MQRVRPLVRLTRGGNAVSRRSYHVSRPNAVWHCDGYHKLIKYGVVIHGFIDGYSRLASATTLAFQLFTY
jgi:hypothetical protein